MIKLWIIYCHFPAIVLSRTMPEHISNGVHKLYFSTLVEETKKIPLKKDFNLRCKIDLLNHIFSFVKPGGRAYQHPLKNLISGDRTQDAFFGDIDRRTAGITLS